MTDGECTVILNCRNKKNKDAHGNKLYDELPSTLPALNSSVNSNSVSSAIDLKVLFRNSLPGVAQKRM